MAGAGSYDTFFSAAVTSTKVQVSAVPVDIGAYQMLNNAAAITYIQVFYKLAADVTVGTTVPDVVIPLPVSGGATIHFGGTGWRTKAGSVSGVASPGLTLASTTTRGGSTTATTDIILWKCR